MTQQDLKELSAAAARIRLGAMEGIFHAKSGHPGGSLSIADLLAYLYHRELNVNPKEPRDENRDRFVLSKGHCAPAYYAALADLGFFPPEALRTLRHIDSFLQGHPDMNKTPGVDMSSGSLGQGISAACGMAKAAKITGKDWRVYTILGDGELQEGQVWEAAMFAGHNQLDNLCVIVDNNGLQIDGDVDKVCSPYPIGEKFEAFRFMALEIDAHNFEQIEDALSKARACKGRPTAIVARSVKGKGVSFMENAASWHGVAPNAEQYAAAKEELERMLQQIEC